MTRWSYAKSPSQDDVASAITQLLADPAAREALGALAATRAATFGWIQTAQGHREVYESLLTPTGNGATSPEAGAHPTKI